MRSRNSSWLCTLAVASAVFAQTPSRAPEQDPPASIAGEVRDAVTGAPIERAHVALRKFVNGNYERYGVFTAADGKFFISGIPGGDYAFALDRTGYVDLNRQADKAVKLSPGEKRENCKLKLIPTGAITGRVLDADGAPAEGITVVAEAGGRPERSTATDDRGMFRLGGLRPGKFRVKAQPLNIPLPPEIRTDGTVEVHYSATYHPNALDAASATRVEVRPATEATGIDIRLVLTPIVRVAGRVTGIPPGAQYINVSFRPQGSGAQARPDGTFEAWRVDPGKYTISANANLAGQNYSSAPVPIEVGQSDVENLVLQVLAPADIEGQAEFDDDEARTPPQVPSGPGGSQSGSQPGSQTTTRPPARPIRRVALRNAEGNSAVAELNADGSFTLNKVSPGKYRVNIMGSRVYVKSMRLGPAAIEGSWLDLTNGAGGAPLTLRVASAKGVVSGVVRDDKGPVAGSTVVMAEEDAGQRIAPQTTTSKEDGSYVFNGIAPGKYKILAIDESDLSVISQSSQEDLEDIAEKIEIGERETVAKDLKRK